MPPAIEAPDEPIAIIGYSCILPGGQNVNESWETIKAGLNCISDLPADRVDVESYFDPNKTSMPGLEPRTSRTSAGLILTRLSLALDSSRQDLLHSRRLHP
jgi:acyl transferase domain-containing protein